VLARYNWLYKAACNTWRGYSTKYLNKIIIPYFEKLILHTPKLTLLSITMDFIPLMGQTPNEQSITGDWKD